MFPQGKTQLELIALLNAGAGLTIATDGKTTLDLLALASAAKKGGGQLTLRGLGGKTQLDLLGFARAGAGHIVFE